jgi:hypothetical protein
LPQGPWQFSLQHLLLATFLLAVALSPLHRVLPPGPIGRLPIYEDLFVILAFFILNNLLVGIPCIWGMAVSWPALAPIALGWLFYCGVLAAVEIGVLMATFGSHGDGGMVFLALFLMNTCQGATVFGTLRIYRALGFRLVRARPSARDTTGSTCL